jgi:regulator of protease activity HflC (stomatin/prohibitin superfamily)
MIGGDKTRSGQPAVDEAMNRVLAAERDARQAVAECRAEAARLVAEAEARARALGGRSEARIRLAHRVADTAIARALAELAEVPPVSDLDRAAEGDPDRGAAIPEPLARSLETLVTEILGLTP